MCSGCVCFLYLVVSLCRNLFDDICRFEFFWFAFSVYCCPLNAILVLSLMFCLFLASDLVDCEIFCLGNRLMGIIVFNQIAFLAPNLLVRMLALGEK